MTKPQRLILTEAAPADAIEVILTGGACRQVALPATAVTREGRAAVSHVAQN